MAVQLVVGMQVLVDVHQPASVGQSVSFAQYAAKPPATVAEELLLQVADLVVVQVER